jgi:spermidine synthase
MDEPFIADDGPWRTLRFSRTAYQSRMHREAPDDLVAGYTRSMMGFLLFVEAPRAIAMIGLGGGSIARYCLRHLPGSRFVGVEINPKVVALRDAFELPPDGPRFAIVAADGAEWIGATDECFDVILLDAFTSEGIPPEVRSRAFFERCHARLAPGGVLAGNFWAGDPRTSDAAERMREAFDGQVVGVRAEDPGHRILFAARDRDLRDVVAGVMDRARALQARHPVDLERVAHALVMRVTGRPPR